MQGRTALQTYPVTVGHVDRGARGFRVVTRSFVFTVLKQVTPEDSPQLLLLQVLPLEAEATWGVFLAMAKVERGPFIRSHLDSC